jgi:uncharacterized protein (TIGR00369 family)
MTDGWGEARTREISWHDPKPSLGVAATMTGLEYLQSMRDGVLPPPPIIQLMGGQLATVDNGTASFTLEPQESHYNPIGVVHGGIVCTMLDSATGCAVHSTLDVGWGYTSIDLNVSYLRAVTLDSGLLTFTGRVIKGGRRVAFATAEGVDAAGNVVATATSSLLVIAPA